MPDRTTLYDALLARDPAWEGRAWVGVTSTGIFCRLTCPARKPKPENCQFFDSISGCISAGFRPCKRCHPLAPAAGVGPAMQSLQTLPD
jgi:AraC family transcriptional regulator, regulatory protein of adaptative response / methylated-DNA-[protein]-cysteine methyltransferase